MSNKIVGKAIKDKHAKVAFLEKLILCVGHFYGQPMEAQPKKIVAGTLLFRFLGAQSPVGCILSSQYIKAQALTSGTF